MPRRNNAGRKYLGIAVYFLIVAPVVFCALTLYLGLASMSSGATPRLATDGAGNPNLIWTLSVYGLLGILASFSRTPDLRMVLCVAAHIGIVITETLPPVRAHDGMMSAFVLCGILAVPFGWAWFELVRNFFSPRAA